MDASVSRRERLPVSLPVLSGWPWLIFVAVWGAVFALGVVGTVLFARDDGHIVPPGEYQLGFVPKNPSNTGIADDGSVVALVLSREARDAGLTAGDRVTALNGEAPGKERLPIRALWERLGRPARVVLRTVSPDGRRAQLTLTARPDHADEGTQESGLSYRTWRIVRTASLVVADGVLPLALGLILLLRRARDRLAPWASLAFVASTTATGPAGRSSALLDAVPWGVWAAVSLVAIWSLALSLTLFPEGRFRPRWCLLVLGGTFLIGALSTFATLSGTVANILDATTFLPAIAVIWVRYHAMPPGAARQQIRWTMFGFALSLMAFAVGLLFQTIVSMTVDPVTFVRADLASATGFDLYSVVLLVAMTLGLMRYRLYDADATISRSVAYGAITLSLLAIFAGSEKVIETLGEERFGKSLGALASGLGAAVAAAMIGPVHGRVTRWAERRFRSGLVHLRLGLPLLVGDLRETATPTALAEAMLLRVERGVRARHGAVIVDGAVLDARDVDPASVEVWLTRAALPSSEPFRLQSARGDGVFPIRVPLHADGVGLVGWLLLGPRPDGTFYGREEREALQEIADPVARALAISIERERRLAEWRNREAIRRDRDAVRDGEISNLRRIVHHLQKRIGWEDVGDPTESQMDGNKVADT